MAKSTKSTKATKMAAAAEAVRKALGLDTLEDRGRDGLDFHDISVASIREVVAIAFEAGYDAGAGAELDVPMMDAASARKLVGRRHGSNW